MRPIIVSYGTRYPSFYPIAREALIENCEALGLEHCIRLIEPAEDWFANTRQKPGFLLKMLRGEIWSDLDAPHARPIMWVDVDCSLTRVDDMPADGWDVGWVTRSGNMAYTAGMMAFNRTEAAERFIESWIERLEREKTPGDHGPYVRTIDNPPKGVRIIDATGYVDWNVNEFNRGTGRRNGPCKCPKCGRGYDESWQGRQITCRQCGKVMVL